METRGPVCLGQSCHHLDAGLFPWLPLSPGLLQHLGWDFLPAVLHGVAELPSTLRENLNKPCRLSLLRFLLVISFQLTFKSSVLEV